MANDQKAYWIWHPGEYEFMLGLNLHAQRFERGGQQTPIWKMEPMFPDAKFYKTVSVPEKTKFLSAVMKDAFHCRAKAAL